LQTASPVALILHSLRSISIKHVKSAKGKVKEKVHTLDIAPLRSETPPQKRSGMALVLKGPHSYFTGKPTRSSSIGMTSHTCLSVPAAAGPRPRRDGRLSRSVRVDRSINSGDRNDCSIDLECFTP